VPICARDGRVLGVLQALNKGDGQSFDASDQEYMTILATHAAVALQNARAFEWMARNQASPEQQGETLEQLPASSDPIGSDPSFLRALELARKVASTDASVLLRGESGTGKGMFARMIHRHSPRSRKSYVEVNCAAIPRDLVETELFGVEKGVATGVDSRIGRLEVAHRGTCFLDEIGDMNLEAQAKILKALDDRKIERVGGRKPIPADVRIVAATHQDLEQLIEAGRFRSDLFFRLDVVSITVPPLRLRGEDVLLLAEHFVRIKAARHRRKTPQLSSEVLDCLRAYAWPGNVRELENVIERGVILSIGDVMRVGDLPPLFLQGHDRSRADTNERELVEDADIDLRAALERTERALLRRALEESDGIQTAAARRLGISEGNLRYRLKRLGT
jgi:transcriptional regulator with GAF, ATPase, and Fis domain